MTLSMALSTVIFFVCMVLIASVILLIKTQLLYVRCMDILMCAYNWLEKVRLREEQEVKGHEGTD